MTTTNTTPTPPPTSEWEGIDTWASRLPDGDPIARARLAGQLAQAATERAEYFARQRALAIKAAVDEGIKQSAIAAELGVTRGLIGKILARLEANQ